MSNRTPQDRVLDQNAVAVQRPGDPALLILRLLFAVQCHMFILVGVEIGAVDDGKAGLIHFLFHNLISSVIDDCSGDPFLFDQHTLLKQRSCQRYNREQIVSRHIAVQSVCQDTRHCAEHDRTQRIGDLELSYGIGVILLMSGSRRQLE